MLILNSSESFERIRTFKLLLTFFKISRLSDSEKPESYFFPIPLYPIEGFQRTFSSFLISPIKGYQFLNEIEISILLAVTWTGEDILLLRT